MANTHNEEKWGTHYRNVRVLRRASPALPVPVTFSRTLWALCYDALMSYPSEPSCWPGECGTIGSRCPSVHLFLGIWVML